jgi:hypothetical protein
MFQAFTRSPLSARESLKSFGMPAMRYGGYPEAWRSSEMRGRNAGMMGLGEMFDDRRGDGFTFGGICTFGDFIQQEQPFPLCLRAVQKATTSAPKEDRLSLSWV